MDRNVGSPAGAPLTNYRLYRAKDVPRTYLVISTYFPDLRPSPAFDEQGAFRELLEDLGTPSAAPGTEAPGRVAVTLRTHGYNVPLRDFEQEVLVDGQAPPADSLRPHDRVYIGYWWPSEGARSGRSFADTGRALCFTGSVGVLLFLLPLLALTGALDALLGVAGRWPWLAIVLRASLAPYLLTGLAAGLLGAGILLLLLRLSTYSRDRYRALHYGVPDLGEFVRDLELSITTREPRIQVSLDVVGHSMGCLMLINAFRVMSDFFHLPGVESPYLGSDGAIELRTLVLCAPDVPAALAQPGTNNYFLSALRRFTSVHVFSSDRDLVLKWASTFANWTSEPRYDMAGRRLGTVLLLRAGRGEPGDPLAAVTRPILRNFVLLDPLQARPRPPRAWVQFHDCTLCRSLAGPPVALAVSGVLAALALAWAVAAWPHLWLQWLLAMVIFALVLGGVARLAWPAERDHIALGGLLGYFADWPSFLLALPFWRGADPHGGYFVRGDAPRRLIARLLREPRPRQERAEEEGPQPPVEPPIRSAAFELPV